MNVLLDWYEKNKRELPWRKTKDPYKILLSEFILQQTRVNQGLNYYIDFLEKYPTIQDLANAQLDEVMRLWQGLGYYSRARNLWLTCKEIVFNLNGVFPSKYSELLKLKGVGEYTAAAIASIAFNDPVAVVDGNVYRVLSRYYEVTEPIDSTKGKKVFKALAYDFLTTKLPGTHNQAIMELGALVCTPASPDCANCPLNISCLAYINGSYSKFPIKQNKQKQRTRHFYYYIFNLDGKTLIQQRNDKDIWNGLYQFPLFECQKPLSKEEILLNLPQLATDNITEYEVSLISKEIKHVLSHQIIKAVFVHVAIKPLNLNTGSNFMLVDFDELEKHAMPRLITRYLESIE